MKKIACIRLFFLSEEGFLILGEEKRKPELAEMHGWDVGCAQQRV